MIGFLSVLLVIKNMTLSIERISNDIHSLLSKLLQKRGIPNTESLSKEEKEWFTEKERILSANDEITVEDLKKFCQAQISLIEEQWKNLDNTTAKNERLITFHTVYSVMLKALSAPKVERELLEKHLEQLIK